MAAAVEMRDDYTGEHSEEVVRLARRVGERLGLTDRSPRGARDRRAAARRRQDRRAGRRAAQGRPAGGGGVGDHAPAPGVGSAAAAPRARPEARVADRASRPRALGRGRLPGPAAPATDIPLESRIIFACDAYHAMTSDRPYRDALRPWIAVSELREGAGGQFDPDVVDVLVNELRDERSVSTRPVPAGTSARPAGARPLRRACAPRGVRRRRRATRAASCLARARARSDTDSPSRRNRLRPCASCTASVGPGRGAEDCAAGLQDVCRCARAPAGRHDHVAASPRRRGRSRRRRAARPCAACALPAARVTRRPPRMHRLDARRLAPRREQHVDRVARAYAGARRPARLDMGRGELVGGVDHDLARHRAALRDQALERARRRDVSDTAGPVARARAERTAA